MGPGARVGVLTKNHARWYELFFGAAKARACLTPVNNRLAAGEIAFILEDAAPVLLFVGEDFFDLALKAVEDAVELSGDFVSQGFNLARVAGFGSSKESNVVAHDVVSFCCVRPPYAAS